MTTFFRSMLPDRDGRPVIGDRSCMLGVRVPDDVEPDEQGVVHPGAGGMSVIADDPREMRPHLLPLGPRFGGTNKRGVVVYAAPADAFVGTLRVRAARRPHHLVEPSRPVPLADLRQALGATALAWSAV